MCMQVRDGSGSVAWYFFISSNSRIAVGGSVIASDEASRKPSMPFDSGADLIGAARRDRRD